MKESLPSTHRVRKVAIFTQSLMSIVTAGFFFYYAFTVETGKTCFYSEDANQISPVDILGSLADVSYSFKVVIIGFAVATLLDFIFQMLRFTEVFPKFLPLIVIL